MGRRWWQKEERIKAEAQKIAAKRAASLLDTVSDVIEDGKVTIPEVVQVIAAVENAIEAVFENAPEVVKDDAMLEEETSTHTDKQSHDSTEEKIAHVVEAAAPVVAAVVSKVVNNVQNKPGNNNNNKNKRRR